MIFTTSNPAYFILIPQVPVVLLAAYALYVRYWLGILITAPHPAPPVGQRIKVQSIGGPPPAGLRYGAMYVVTWARGNEFRMRRISLGLGWNFAWIWRR